MERVKALWTALYTAALSLWVMPALALAQSTGQSGQAGSAPAPATGTTSGDAGTGGSGWLWIIAALVVLALIWWGMASRRRGTVTR